MMSKLYALIGICLFLLFSTSAVQLKPENDKLMQEGQEQNPQLGSALFSNQPVYPLTPDVGALSKLQGSNIRFIYHDLNVYKQVYGQFPQSIPELLKSGFLISWPANLSTGNPSVLFSDHQKKLTEKDFASFSYRKLDEDRFELKYPTLDTKLYKTSGGISWKETVFPYVYRKDGVMIDVMAGTKVVDEIPDFSTREIYAMAGALAIFIRVNSTDVYLKHGKVPDSMDDLFTGKRFLIKENYFKLADLLQKSGADFRWGVDRNQNAEYIILRINGEVYISGCCRFGDHDNNSPFASDGMNFGCDINELDTSSPILSTVNMKTITIPEEFFISIADIPVV